MPYAFNPFTGTLDYYTSTSGSVGTFASETASQTPDGIITTFTFAHSVGVIVLNGVEQFVGGGLASSSGSTAVFNNPPQVGDDVRNTFVA